ncbi:helix-turn-helix transcriptional regulator [Bacillus sp. ISL-45]|uniref:helix-turn-helix transcriptional regulator n=1 Tax=Bacillus sp. ISL-45 TaxID=2819128 RepID=UPI001BE65AE3|nr:helix-turn-helix transcriptional regulator [Bacillus sp. ISL-45]
MKPRIWLQEKRIAANLTQEDVAKGAQIKRPYYSQIESGARRPSVSVAQEIAKVVGFEWVLFFENNCSEKQQKSNLA